MSSRDNALWLQFWRDHRTDFHQKAVNQLLKRFWPGLNSVSGSRVFVPLCGKSLDMLWLAGQGHEVVGVELSPVAVRAFFRENRLQPVRRQQGKFTVWQHGNISIWCGDFFSLLPVDLGHIDLVYDRASLTALPEDVRKLYVTHLRSILPQTITFFLLTAEDADETGAPALPGEIDAEIAGLFSADFDIDLTHAESVFEPNPGSADQTDVATEYKVYRLSSKSRE